MEEKRTIAKIKNNFLSRRQVVSVVNLVWILDAHRCQTIAVAENVVRHLMSDHEGEFVDFTFVPSTAEARQATGRCRIIPLQFGGDDIEGRPQAEFEYVCEAKPVLAAVV